MFGEVVVGDGGAEPAAETTDEESEDTPGFMIVSTVIAVIGALALMGRYNREDL